MNEKNNIENFFKKRLESQHFPFQERDWENLEQRLEASIPPTHGNNYYLSQVTSIFKLFFVLAVTFLLGWFTRDQLSTKDSGKMQPTPSTKPYELIVPENNNPIHSNSISEFSTTKKTKPKTDGEIISKNYINKKKKKSGILSPHTHAASDKINSQKNEKPMSKNKDYANSKPVNQGLNHIANMPKIKPKNNQLHSLSSFDQATISNTSPGKPKSINEVDSDYISYSFLSPTEPFLLPRSNEDIVSINLERLPYSDSTKLEMKTRIPLGRKLKLGISLAPDLTSVGTQGITSASMRFGGHIFYYITPKWIVSISALYSNKKYDTKSEYYTPPEGYWIKRTNGIRPDNIIGSCKVIDLPVMITYQLAQLPSAVLTASTGISNYFLLDEKYDFEFNKSNPGAAPGWYTEENSPAPLSILNLAIGAEFNNRKKIGVIIEPYLKVPIKQVGWGNVALYSTGIQLTLKLNSLRY